MLKKTFMALAVAGTLAVAGCGGGGGGGGSDSGGPSTQTRNDVVGPLDGLQGGLSGEILAPLGTAVAGTPLAGVVDCLDQAVVSDILDITDAIVLGVRPGSANPAAQLTATAAQVQAEASDLVADLQGLVLSLAGSSGCTANALAQTASGNPLAGTQLAALGSQLLPVLNSVQAQLSSPSNPLSLGQISGLLGLVTQAFNGATGLIPPEADNAPVVGGVFDVLSQALTDVQLTVAAAGTGNPTTAAAQVTTTVQNLLDGLLTDVIPIGLIENTSGQPGVVSGPIQDAINQLTSVLGGGLGSLSPTALASALQDPTSLLLNPLQNDVLTLILGPIQQAIAGGGLGGGSIPLLTGTPLDGVLATLTGVLSGGAGGDPLTSLLGSLLGGLGGVGGGGAGASCPLVGTPLAVLCGVLGG